VNIIPKNILTTKTARYYIAGPPDAGTIWFVIHGYGQLAGDFIKEFDYLADGNTLVVAPEGLSRAYMSGKIAASWMTKEDRENEIKDYVNYLNAVFEEITKGSVKNSMKINVLGFSQGVHTAARWFTLSKYQFSNLFLCSSDFPQDTDFLTLNKKLKKGKLYYMCGDKDDFIPSDLFEAGKKLLTENNVVFEEFTFSGKHIVEHELIKKIIAR